MDKQLIEMMGTMMVQINDVQSDMKNMKSDLSDMKMHMMNTKSDLTGMKTHMKTRFDAVDDKLNGVVEHFVEHSKNNIQLREEMKKELKYVTYKIHALDREVFMRTDSPQ